ncbi:MAG: alpha-ketoacid dehydrogenase subunit beta [Nitrososphaerota archaeon]
MRQLTYAEALNEALREEMKRDGSIIIFGEDVAAAGGVYRVTKGLLEEFGPERVRDTPISEIAIVGMAIGASLMGLRPVAEIMYMDFVYIAMDQLVTHAAKLRFMSGGQLKLPFVVRTQYSLGRAHGAQHSQFFPSAFLQAPGLKVVAPGTPRDAKGLLKAALRQDSPVLFIECGYLYHRLRGEVPDQDYITPLGRAEIKRRGTDITIACFSRTVQEALRAADLLSAEGIEAEVLDLMTLQPIDFEALFGSVKRTNRLLVAEDDIVTGGIGAELAARAAEETLDYLDAPIVRVGSPPMPVPFSPELEKRYMVSAEAIAAAAKRLVRG